MSKVPNFKSIFDTLYDEFRSSEKLFDEQEIINLLHRLPNEDINKKKDNTHLIELLLFNVKNMKYIDILMNRGLNVNFIDKSYGLFIKSLMFTSRNSFPFIFKFLDKYIDKFDIFDDINNKNNLGMIFDLVDNGNSDSTEILVNMRLDVNLIDDKGRTLLMTTANCGYPFSERSFGIDFEPYKKIIKILLDAGADVNIKDKDGNDCFDYALTQDIKNYIYDNSKI